MTLRVGIVGAEGSVEEYCDLVETVHDFDFGASIEPYGQENVVNKVGPMLVGVGVVVDGDD